MATAKSLSGPWTVESLRITDQWLSDEVYCTHTNPTVQILANGTWVLAFNAGYCNQHLETIGVAVCLRCALLHLDSMKIIIESVRF